MANTKPKRAGKSPAKDGRRDLTGTNTGRLPTKARQPLINDHVILAVLLVLVLVYAAGNLFAYNLTSSLEKRVEDARPARIELTVITDPSCAACTDFSGVAAELPADRFTVLGQKRLEWTSPEAKRVVETYGLQTVPALIITGEVDRPAATEFFTSAGLPAKNRTVILSGIPPYRDLENGNLVGLVSLTLLNDSTCTSCYDVNVNRAILQNFGVSIQSERTLDVGSDEGKRLLLAYNITKVPAAVLSKDAQVYLQFLKVWPQVGTVEPDGSLVLRSAEVMGAYRDLTTGQIVIPAAPPG